MNAKRNNLMIVAAVAVVLWATPAFAHLEHYYTPAGVWVPRPHTYTPDEIKAASENNGFDLLAGIGKAVTGLPKAVGNLFETILPGGKQKAEMEVSKVTDYREIQNASGVTVRVPMY